MPESLSLQEARALGRKTYFTGLPCRAGHVAERRVNNSSCCECIKAWSLRYASAHREQVRTTTRAWREANPNKVQAYAEKNRARDVQSTREWEKRNPGKVNAKTALRKERIRQATPGWADFAEIQKVYQRAAEISRSTGIPHHVDHIVPIRSKIVCGLHCPANLEAVPAAVNVRKKNLFWPDMPDQL